MAKRVNNYKVLKMQYRFLKILLTLTCLFCFTNSSNAQDINAEENNNPVILYSGTPKKYEIGEIGRAHV